MLENQQLARFYEERMRNYNPLERRLAHEHTLVDELCAQQSDISYKIIHQAQPPYDSRVTLTNLRSITGIDQDQLPRFGSTHVFEMRLTPGFPLEPPVCYMSTPVWHPNIQSEPGPFQGRICGNTEGFGAFYSLDSLILRIRAMLAWETYHAEMTDPYPEDEDVARWVREAAEPLGICQNGLGLTPEWTVPENWRALIVPEKKLKISMV